MKRLSRFIFAAGALLVSAASAFGQGAILQGGPWTPGHSPQYVGSGSGQAIVQDSGAASGAPTLGVGLAEQLLTVRNPLNVYPAIGVGSGPLGSNWCDYDAPINNPTGYHYICLSPNPGLLIFGFGGAASPLPFSLNINGTVFALPTSGNGLVTTTIPTTNGSAVCFSGTTGLVAPCQIANSNLATVPAATFKGNPTATAGIAPTDFTIQGLPPRGAPDASNDKIPLFNFSTGAINYVTPGLIASSATAGVSSLCGLTGALTATQNSTCLNLFSTSLQGAVPASGGGTTNFLRADGTFAVPPGVATTPGGSTTQLQYNNAGAFGGVSAWTWNGTTLFGTANSASIFQLQDATSSQDKLVFGVQSSTTCDPSYIGTPGSGPCFSIIGTPNSISSTWQTLLLQSTNGRAILASTSSGQNPALECSGLASFGVPVLPGANQSGCGYVSNARPGSGQPISYNLTSLGATPGTMTASSATSSGGRSTLTVTVQSGTAIGIGQQISNTTGSALPAVTLVVGNSTTNAGFCSPNCTGGGGTGTYSIGTVTGTITSEGMTNTATGAEASMVLNLFAGSQDGFVQSGMFVYNAVNCPAWGSCFGAGTPAGSRLWEVAGFGMSNGDALFTQTELVSENGYSEALCNGTHLDGSYTCPTNLVGRTAPNAAGPERITWVHDYNGNLLLGANGSSAGFTVNANLISSSTTNSLVFWPATGNPTNNPPTNGGLLYTLAGALKYKSGAGTVTTVAPN